MNALDAARLGRYAFEVSDAEIRAARVVASDLHWAVGLPGFLRLVEHVRSTNPAAVIVAGGITAGHYASELVRLGVDYVLRGDSERSFALLVKALLAGSPSELRTNLHRDLPRDLPTELRPDLSTDLPNVVSRSGAGPSLRMTQAEFDATDCLTLGWFPTLSRVSDWPSAAFSPSRTLPAARGCPMRCPACYGSHASLYGPGTLTRSPGALASEVARAASLGVSQLRLICGKPPARTLTAWLRALAASGPHRFDSMVGLYLCTAPSDEDLDLLHRAFASPVALSVIPAEEHAPALPPGVLQREQAAWRRVVARLRDTDQIQLDVWATTPVDVDRIRRELDAEDHPGVRVSLGTVWNLLRPSDGAVPDMDTLRSTMDVLWTWLAARLLSPALSEALLPFALLDEVDDPPPNAPHISPAAWAAILGEWERHRLPLLPALSITATPVLAGAHSAPRRTHAGVRYEGALAVHHPGELSAPLGPPTNLPVELTHRGARLRATLEIPAGADAIALHAAPLPGESASAAPGLVVVTGVSPGTRTLRITLRMMDAWVDVSDRRGLRLASGRADLGGLRPPPEGYERERPLPLPWRPRLRLR
ncbi:MAG: hypothetical protein AMXMBFR64_47900 [Myxococcales bacterium]